MGGKYQGPDLVSPNDSRVRPTGEHVPAALLDVLAAAVTGARVLGLLAGGGALELDAPSRGAKRTDCVEFQPAGSPH